MPTKKSQRIRRIIYGVCVLCCIMMGIATVLIWPDGNTGWTYDVHRFERSIMPPFYSYKEALHFAAASYHYLMINIGMFVPLGFVLPVGNTWFRKFVRMVGTAFFLALFMELGRCLATSTAIDPDNVVNHIAGAMIGYGAYVIFEKKAVQFRKEGQTGQSRSGGAVFLYQIPLCAVLIVLIGIPVLHGHRELGDMSPYEVIIPFQSKTISVNTEKDWSDETAELPVCKIKPYTEREAAACAGRIFDKIGETMKESSVRTSDGTMYMQFQTEEGSLFFMTSHNGEYDFERPSGYTQAHPLENEDGTPVTAAEQEVRDALSELGIEVPVGAVFSAEEVEEDGYHYFRANMLEEAGFIYHGDLRCQYTADGNIAEVRSRMDQFQVDRTAAVISEAEAYWQICSGMFYWTDMDNHIKALPREIQVQDCTISYKADTKHFYQPVYVFQCKINNLPDEITIPCIQYQKPGQKYSETNKQQEAESPYVIGKHVSVSKAEIESAADFYELSGLEREEAMEKAIAYMEEREALYYAAVKHGFHVTDEEEETFEIVPESVFE